MPPLALSFPEVLEDEYRYLFADEPFKPVTFDRAHVREIADLANFLETAFRPGGDSTSCWQLLADHCFGKDGTRSRTESREDALVVALNEMLREPAMLENLTADDQFRRDLIESPQLQQSLLRIPKARRLLLERPELAVEMADDAIIDAFASRSPAIRLLVHAGFRPAFRTYPALLSTVADNAALSAALERNPEVRQNLIRMFSRPAVDVAIHWFAARLSRRLGAWLLKTLIDRPNDLVTMSQDAGKLLGMIDPDAESPSETPAIPIEHLSRFNGLLLETAYRHYLSNGQTVRALYSAFYLQDTTALCLSGGGIRSATFNLGILQGLADHRILNRIHYLSTVSGGGYIGSWLSSWMRRHGEGSIGVAKDLSRQVTDPLLPEVKPIVHLREYSSYLAPRASAFSLDGWTLVATYLRNLFLNWTMLLPFLVAALSVPRLLETHFRQSMMVPAPHLGIVLSRHWLDVVKRLMFLPEHRLGLIAAGLAFFSTTAIGAMRPTCKPIAEKAQRPWPLWWWLAPLGFSGIAFCVYWAWPGNMFVNGRYLLMGLFAAGAMLGAIVHAGKRLWIHVMAETGSSEQSRLHKTAIFLISFFKFRKPFGFAVLEIAFAAVAGAMGGWLLHGVFLYAFSPDLLQFGARTEAYVCLALPLYLSVFCIEATLLVGFTTLSSEEYEREWWARGAAALLVYGLFHITLAFAVVFLPIVIFQAPKLAAPFGGLAGIASYLLSRQLKMKRLVGDEGARNQWLLPLLRLAAGVTMMFIVATISILTSSVMGMLNENPGTIPWLGRFWDFHAVHFTLPWQVFGDYLSSAAFEHFKALRLTPWTTIYLVIAASTLLAMTMSRLLNVNVYSMHSMYRNRLMRAYLGASRWVRRPDPFTGFDPQDNLRMWELRPEMLWPTSIIDFDSFARQLPVEKFWSKVPVDAQNHLLAYLSASKTDDRRSLRETAKTLIVDAINQLMLTIDMKHQIPATPSLELLAHNRRYLDSQFSKFIKHFDRDVDLPPATRKAAPAIGQPAPSTPTPSVPSVTPPPLCGIEAVLGRPPLHIVNAALNLVAGENLAWQERKAASFTISPLHSGSRELGYRDSFNYGGGGGITLGTALAISGAAVSPNSGASSSPTFTFLMTLLNARLGWWIGNPRHRRFQKNSPTGSIQALLREALGRTDAEQDFVFLSDGGHFENLGLYEMVLRRCKYIIVCDATADDRYAFGDLANAVRKIRVDLGVPIEPLVTKYIGPQKDEKYGKYCATGLIGYGGGQVGHLLYIKPALYSDCPPDVRNYGSESKSFPHENTMDQFFSESQFESYRALGRHIIGTIARDKIGEPPNIARNVAAFFNLAEDYVKQTQSPIGDTTVGSMKDVVSWMATSLG